MGSSDEQQGAGYWYPAAGTADDGASAGASTSEDSRATSVDVLNALRSYRTIESNLRKELSQRLNINETDLAGLRYLFGVWQADEDASPKELALALGISSASTTLVIDRLEKAGFITRRRHPVDRRSVILEPGERATRDFQEAFDIEKHGVVAAADTLTDAEIDAVERFLRSMEQALSESIGEQHQQDTP